MQTLDLKREKKRQNPEFRISEFNDAHERRVGKEEFRIQSLKGSWRESEERIRIQNTEFKMKGQRAEFKIKQELRIHKNY